MREDRRPPLVERAEREGRLAVHEVYAAIQGESTWAGAPGVIVRLTGCPLRCAWCDTRYAYEGGVLRGVAEVVAEVGDFDLPIVLVTGGEPLFQSATLDLIEGLADVGKTVLVETSGALDISGVDPRAHRIMDLKAPGSGESKSNLLANIEHLTVRDEVKIILTSRDDYEWAREVIRRYEISERCTVLLGAVFGALDPAELAAWILKDRLPVRLQLQIHKLLWPPETRGV